jgi:molybdopterin synthase catalytic subunit
MQVIVLPFGMLKDKLGATPVPVELPDGATVADLLAQLAHGQPAPWFRGIAVSVNAEYVTAARILAEGDEVGLLPPVSGGSARPEGFSQDSSPAPKLHTALVRDPIDANALVAALKRGEDGAVVVFDGIVRNHTRGRRTLHLDYEVYEELATKQMRDLAQQAVQRFAIRDVAIVHRLGRLQVGETSVLIAVASPHRAAAFEASRWLIDALKSTVPIWKRETFADGAVWAPGDPFPASLAVSPQEPPSNA